MTESDSTPSDDPRAMPQRAAPRPPCRHGCAGSLRALAGLLGLVVAGAVAAALVAAIALAVSYPNLPDIGSLTDYRPKLPMRDLLRRRRAARRVRRGAAQLHADRRDPEGHAGRRARRRGREVLPAQRRQLRQRHPRRARQLRRRAQRAGRLDHHDAGRAQFLSVDRENIYSQDLRDVAGFQDREPAHARTRFSRST